MAKTQKPRRSPPPAKKGKRPSPVTAAELLLEIGVEDLRMTDDEATQVLAVAGAVSGRARVMRTAAGWPAVLGLAAMSGEQFGWATIMYFIRNTGIPVNFGMTVLIALIVGTVVAGQTFYIFTIENLKSSGHASILGGGISGTRASREGRDGGTEWNGKRVGLWREDEEEVGGKSATPTGGYYPGVLSTLARQRRPAAGVVAPNAGMR